MTNEEFTQRMTDAMPDVASRIEELRKEEPTRDLVMVVLIAHPSHDVNTLAPMTRDQVRDIAAEAVERGFPDVHKAITGTLALATDDAVPMVFLVASEGVYHNVGTSRYVTVALPDAAAFNPGGGGKA